MLFKNGPRLTSFSLSILITHLQDKFLVVCTGAFTPNEVAVEVLGICWNVLIPTEAQICRFHETRRYKTDCLHRGNEPSEER